MEGTLQQTGEDQNGNPVYVVTFYSLQLPVSLRDVGVRDIKPGEAVTFMTDRETGDAILGELAPVRGCEAPRRGIER